MAYSLGDLGVATGVVATKTAATSLNACAGTTGVAVSFNDFKATSVDFVYATAGGYIDMVWGDGHSDTAMVYGNSKFGRITTGKVFTFTSSDTGVAYVNWSDNAGNFTVSCVTDVFGSAVITCSYTDPFNGTAVSGSFTVNVSDGRF